MNCEGRTNCCLHLGGAHVSKGSKIAPGASCTIPDCPCTGWIPRTKASGPRATTVSMIPKILALFAEGLDGPTIAERLGVTASFVYHTRKQAKGSS